MTLKEYGWNSFFQTAFDALEGKDEWHPGRVIFAGRGAFRLRTQTTEINARLAGRALGRGGIEDRPTVGDWVAFELAGGEKELGIVRRVLPRKSKISRKVSGARTEEQLIAANLDKVFLVMGLDGDFNLRRLERLLVTAWDSGALPVVLLNKADLCPDPRDRRARVEAVAPGVEVRLLSCEDGTGLAELESFVAPGETIALLGSSGVGKSTLINRLIGKEHLRTQSVRASDDRGRHTTTHRELVRLEGGGLIIDNPGIRELQLWRPADRSSAELGDAFDDIARLAEGCRYTDCAHTSEPGCAIRDAVTEGHLSSDRLHSYFRLQKELRYLTIRQDQGAQREQRLKWRAIHRAMRKTGSHRRT